MILKILCFVYILCGVAGLMVWLLLVLFPRIQIMRIFSKSHPGNEINGISFVKELLTLRHQFHLGIITQQNIAFDAYHSKSISFSRSFPIACSSTRFLHKFFFVFIINGSTILCCEVGHTYCRIF